MLICHEYSGTILIFGIRINWIKCPVQISTGAEDAWRIQFHPAQTRTQHGYTAPFTI